ncbi:MFS transporter [Candidatus Puniceispirillum marinum]|uniref:Tetracycline resistance protein n=1 Tax=Puniceispirillum marinum (strain IMCC1322) TaxID=488538 RepID=D5BSW8_PUNMI|nr:MFS transporter [Candidatus Puniceispirillum marinum]ADE39365.1 tetracycline resistance protein [Candidatus Puniceispirillum marinum IMCC1322]
MFALLLVVFINFVGIGALIPILPYTVVDTLGQSATVMTALLASFALAMFVANPILGWLSDRIGRRSVLVVSLIVGALAHIWFAFSNEIFHMFAARILAGLAAGNTGVIQAIIADRVKAEERAKYMGLLGAAIGTGFVAGPALGGLLSGLGDGPLHQAPFLVAAMFSIIAFGLALRLSETSIAAPIKNTDQITTPLMRRIHDILTSPLALYAIAYFCLNLAFAQVEASFVLLLKDYLDFDARATGWLFTYVGVCIVLVQAGLINPVVRKFGEVGTIAIGVILLGTGQAMTVLISLDMFFGNAFPLAQMLLATTAVCFGYALSNPSLTAAVSNIAGRNVMGGSLGTVQGFGSLGQVLGLIIAGPLYELGGAHYSFGVGTIVTVCLLVIVTQLARPQPSAVN